MVLKKARKNTVYQTPPSIIADLINTPSTPSLRISPDAKWLMLLARPSLPSIQEVAQKELRLAGLRINPKTNGTSRSSYYTGIKLRTLQNSAELRIKGLPRKARIENVSWALDSQHIAFTNTRAVGIELWLIDVASLEARKLTGAILNDTIGGLPYKWFSDSKSLIFKTVPSDRMRVPRSGSVPKGPIIQLNDGKTAILRTYQDLLRNEYDEQVFKHYTTSSIQILDLETDKIRPLGVEGIINGFTTSPDGNYILLSRILQPFSYHVPCGRFPFEVLVYTKAGTFLKRIADVPLAETIPQGFGAVRKGMRAVSWRPDKPATLAWVEAQDNGDPKQEAAFRDQLFFWDAPFQEEVQAGPKFQLRYGGTAWGDGQLAISYEWWWHSRKMITARWRPDDMAQEREVLFDRSWEDAYSNPGSFELERNALGRMSLMQRNDGNTLYLRGEGASPKGNQPFIDELDLTTRKRRRIWQSTAPHYEYPLLILNPEEGKVITSKESKTECPNYFLRQLNKDKIDAITLFEHPYEALKNIQRELVQYKRADGVELTGTLYLPENYDKEKDRRLAVFMWAYPKEYKSKDTASQVKTSPYEFTRLGWSSPLFWVTQGFAVFDDFGMPIVGEDDEEPNETFIAQLKMSAEAAVNTLVEMGIADPKRIAVGGHSYGAFMTANLLAHTDLFAAGIARSGAYNRTLTPFGFQSEERTFWQAPEVYMSMSPFAHADKIKAPLLLIHGEADNNAGTYPMQSERLFNALKGHGATTRLVMLPHESHGYRACESILHMLWEMTNWLNQYVRDKE